MANDRKLKRKQYNAFFEIDKVIEDKKTSSSEIIKDRKLKAAFEKAHDIRKFEIDLYWKRTAYFWTLIAAIFAGYFLLLTTEESKLHQKELYLVLVSSIGAVFSYAWLLAAKGSKFWQENWELHLDMLEDEVTGPLYKIVLEKSDPKEKTNNSKAFSVSRINQWIASFVIAIWIGLILSPIAKQLFKLTGVFENNDNEKAILLIAIEVVIIAGTYFFVKAMKNATVTDLKEHPESLRIKATQRHTKFRK